MSGVLFVNMPFGGIERPQIGISTLKSRLLALGVPCDIAYLNLPFAAALGYDTYSWLTNQYDYTALAGEWAFAHTLFPRRPNEDIRYWKEILVGQSSLSRAQVDRVRAMQRLAGPFLDYCLRAVDWSRYSVVGFTSTFEQNIPSLALARRIKERFPHTVIVFGGGNCGSEMGLQLHRSFPWVDYVFTGEADLSFPELVRRLGVRDTARADLPGYVRRENGESRVTPPGTPLRDLDALPFPNYDDFFRQIAVSPISRQIGVLLQIETSRGCWWGAKQRCTFCGLNRDEVNFRAKSGKRAVDEIEYLTRRYRVKYVGAVDNILSMKYFDTMLPELKRRRLGVRLFYETKANLKRDQVKLLRDAGVASIQPGVESLSGHELHLMQKGTTPLQNVQLLKWCAELGLRAHWNILYGFPGERVEDHHDVLRMIASLPHLPPPEGCGPLRLDRFSRYFDNPEQFGITILGALPAYRHLYPLEKPSVDNLAYFFEYEFRGKDRVGSMAAPLQTAVERWKQVYPFSRLEVATRRPDEITVRDTRANRRFPTYRFGEPEKTVIEFADPARTFEEIHTRLMNDFKESAPSDTWLRSFLAYLVQHRLMVDEGGRYLSVVLSGPRPEPEW